MDMKNMKDDFIVCPCKEKTKAEIMQIIKEKKITDLQSLREIADVGTKCGACAEDLESLIKMVWGEVDPKVFRNFSYGLFVLTANRDGHDNGCIINTGVQLTTNPNRITIAVNKANFTHDMIMDTGLFNLSFLAESAVFDTFRHFGFQTGKEVDKFDEHIPVSYKHSANGLAYITSGTNAFLSAKVIDHYDYGTHTLFIAEVTESGVLNDEPSLTYAYYFEHVKPQPQPKPDEKPEAERHGFVCKICGYFYEGDTLPADFICPICKHPASDFERIG